MPRSPRLTRLSRLLPIPLLLTVVAATGTLAPAAPAAVAATAATPAAAAAHGASSFWSTQLQFDDNGTAWSTASFAALKADGLTTVEINMPWNNVEPSPGTFDFTELDTTLANAAAAGLTVVPIFWESGRGDLAVGDPRGRAAAPAGLPEDRHHREAGRRGVRERGIELGEVERSR